MAIGLIRAAEYAPVLMAVMAVLLSALVNYLKHRGRDALVDTYLFAFFQIIAD